jgi:hypothetical protein
MIVTYQLGAATLSVDVQPRVNGVSAAQLGDALREVVAALITTGTGISAAPGIELTAKQREQLADLLSGTDSLDTSVDGSTGTALGGLFATANGASSQVTGSGRVIDHLEVVDLDDDDALARIAFDAYVIAEGGSYPAWERAETQEAWRAAAAAVRTATLLQQANRAVADA